jgi:hypothetical protein
VGPVRPVSAAGWLTPALVLALAAVALAACAPAASATASTSASATPPTLPSGTGSAAAGLELQPLAGASPATRTEAGVAVAFDTDAAAKLVSSAPSVDYATRALLCVFLGERSGRWTLDLQSAQLSGSTLSIEARERPPRTAGTDVTTPAACGTLQRDGLPAGELKVSAHDTVSDEFITEGTIEVPTAPGGS